MKKIIILYYYTARNTEAAVTIRSCALENFVLQSRGLSDGEGESGSIVYAGRAVSGGPPARPSRTQPRLVLAHVRRKSEFVERLRRRLNTTRSRGAQYNTLFSCASASSAVEIAVGMQITGGDRAKPPVKKNEKPEIIIGGRTVVYYCSYFKKYKIKIVTTKCIVIITYTQSRISPIYIGTLRRPSIFIYNINLNSTHPNRYFDIISRMSVNRHFYIVMSVVSCDFHIVKFWLTVKIVVSFTSHT